METAFEKFCGGLIIVAGILLLAAIYIGARDEEKHGGCVEYQSTGALTCWGSASYKRCEPDKVCVRYGDGSRP